MKLLVAITLVVVAIASAEPPVRRESFQRQAAAPYQPRGWRPSGPPFNPNLNFQKQKLAPEPSPSYGPPPSASYGPPAEGDSTEEPTSTEPTFEGTTESVDFQGEDLKASSLRKQPKAEKLQNEPQAQLGQVYVVVPQSQNYIYTTALRQTNAALIKPSEGNKEIEIIKEPKLAPVQAVPALAKIQAPVLLAKYEQVPSVIQFQQIQALPYIKYVSTLSQSAVRTPYSDSFIQVYQ